MQKKLAKNQSIERIADDLVEDVEVIRKIVEELNCCHDSERQNNRKKL